jgi:hypothetical protein
MNIEDLLSSEVCECCVGGRKWSELAVGRVAEGLVKVHGMVAVAEACGVTVGTYRKLSMGARRWQGRHVRALLEMQGMGAMLE